MKRLSFIALACWLAAGCSSVPSKTSLPSGSSGVSALQELQRLDTQGLVQWFMENEAFVEWQVATLAASCNQVADSAVSPAARREALRVKAAYATSSYAITAGSNPLVQVLDLVAVAALSCQVWVEEGRAVSEFGAAGKPVEVAFTEIRARAREHARKRLSANELEEVERMVRQWRKDHPGPVVAEFIRFEAFADEVAASLGTDSSLGGLFGRIAAQAQGAQLLGERVLLLASRTPRLAQWHAEAAAANTLAQREVAEAITALKQLGELQRTLPEQFKALQALDARLASMPAELAGAVAKQPELKEALAQAEQAGQQVKSLETSLQTLERSVTGLVAQLAQLTSSTRPEALQQVADHTGRVVLSQARALILLAAGCALVVVVLNALLRRWSNKTQRRE